MGHVAAAYPDRFTWLLARGTGWLLLRLGAAMPGAMLVLFYSYVARATLALGHLPVPYAPGPRDMGMHLHHDCIAIGLNLTLLSPLALLFARLMPCSHPARIPWGWYLLWVGGWCMLLVVAFCDPGDLFAWYFD